MAGIARALWLVMLLKSFLSCTHALNVHNLNVGEKYHCLSNGDKKLEIYCYSPQAKNILHMWRTVSVALSIPPNLYEFYIGPTPMDVYKQYDTHQSSWNINLFSNRSPKITLHPFNGSCLGIYTEKEYHATFNVIWVDFWKVLMMAGGVILFMLAPKLSHNVFFYYLCGMTLGVCASFLFILFLFSKVLPRRPAMLMFLVGGWTVSVYLLQLVWSNLQTLLVEYPSFVLSYTCFTAFISFIVCYRFGPVTDPRSKNLIKWTLQAFSLGLMYFSTEFQEAAISVMIIVISLCNFPSSLVNAVIAYWRKTFPPRVKLLSEPEFVEEGVKETRKALGELKKHCSSPDCNTWKTVLKLKDPVRFAAFIEGEVTHITEEEVLLHESDCQTAVTELLTEESNSDSE
ncbi:nuclear envelope integral membrane protein 1-like isoform X2 [Ischnura elegans]|uniref:nuclear envelope integral membrane protein 1-like isoform X2 n=1 Tax=Ischnura elegans TaxID=197161 RepID=UPI001ED8803C|nr:nuclear envelope integral membrane protein 1-like isoform X2 [Ischnura elegans]